MLLAVSSNIGGSTMRGEEIGNATLYLGDCRDVMQSGVEAHVCVMDPPYGISYQSGHATEALWKAGKKIEQDDSTASRDFMIHLIHQKWGCTFPILCFGSWRAARPAATKMVLIWDKGGALGMGDLSLPWKPDHEEIYVIGSGFIGSRDSGSVIRNPPVQSMARNGREHPNQKPVGLMGRLIAKTAGTVFDPFMGSGSTGAACALAGRQFVGCEIRHEYFDIACRRIEDAQRQVRMFP